MASKVVKVCDQHAASDVEVAGDTVDVTIAGTAYEVDLCAEDYDIYVKPLLSLVTDHGRRTGGSGKPSRAPIDPNDERVSSRTGLPRRGLCELCNDGKTVNLGEHSRRVHGLNLHEYWVKIGKAEPSTHICRLCSPERDLGNGQGLAAHGRAIHGLNIEDFRAANNAATEAKTEAEQKPATAGRRRR